MTRGRELADRGEHEEAAEPVDRAEQDQEVARLEPRRAVAERDRRDRERQPAEPQHEEELLHELGAVRIRRPERRHQRLAGQDHHVADLLEQVLGRQEHPVCGGSDHSTVCYHSTGTFARTAYLGTSVLSHRHSAVACRACRASSTSASTAEPVSPWARSWPAASGRRSRTARSSPATRVPSVRELADIAGVNVNTARAVYARLESEGRRAQRAGPGHVRRGAGPRRRSGHAAGAPPPDRGAGGGARATATTPPRPGRIQGGRAAGARRPALDRGPRGRTRPAGRPPPRARRAARRGSPAARRTRRRGRADRGGRGNAAAPRHPQPRRGAYPLGWGLGEAGGLCSHSYTTTAAPWRTP